jgi:hypothetical protein
MATRSCILLAIEIVRAACILLSADTTAGGQADKVQLRSLNAAGEIR